VAYQREVRGLIPLPLAYDLRNKRVRMRQNMVFSKKNMKNFLGRGHNPIPDLSPSGDGDTPSTPHPRQCLWHREPSHSKFLDTPLTGVLFCDPETSFSQIQLQLLLDLSSQIWPDSAPARFEKVKSGATLVNSRQKGPLNRNQE